jgi:predicted Zn-dependent protease with MMP-like domain
MASGARGASRRCARCRRTAAVLDVGQERFEELVGDALDSLPDDLASAVDNVVVVVEDSHRAGLLGLYEGYPLTERGDYGGLVLPDRITIYRLAILGQCRTEEEVVDEVRTTVLHELAHHFGITDERLDELGWS